MSTVSNIQEKIEDSQGNLNEVIDSAQERLQNAADSIQERIDSVQEKVDSVKARIKGEIEQIKLEIKDAGLEVKNFVNFAKVLLGNKKVTARPIALPFIKGRVVLVALTEQAFDAQVAAMKAAG